MCSVHFARGDPIRSHGCSMNFDTFARGGPSRFHRISIFVDVCTMGTPFGSHRIPLDIHPLSKLGFLRISTYFHLFCQGYPSEFVGFQWICIHFARGTAQNQIGFHVLSIHFARVPLWISQDFNVFQYICKGHPLGFHRISMDANTFARISVHLHPFSKGCPLRFHRISLDLRPFCKGYALGCHWISNVSLTCCNAQPSGWYPLGFHKTLMECDTFARRASLGFHIIAQDVH